jgi:hypothetical protein
MKTRSLLLALGLGAASLSSACGVEGAVGCDFREGGANGAEDRCQERSGLGAPVFSAACETLQGTVVEGGCPREGIVVGCQVGEEGDGTPVIDWYYAPMTREEVETQKCLGSREELVEP